ncbi:MAG: 2-deoxy-5-keto-D-gluconate 6-phosphate aldolase domain-containing protein [Candidatus Levyibacteriota bacterium]
MNGYNKPLYILPFDHRSTFLKGMFGISGREPTPEEIEEVKTAKKVIYEAFQKAVVDEVPKIGAAILVDEQFGTEILLDAREKGFTTILTTEKSGQELFDFEYGADFKNHIEKIKPTFVKALVRYNPEGNPEDNKTQLGRLKILSDFCSTNNYKFLIEPLIPPTEEELVLTHGDKKMYDREIRPELAVRMIKEFQDAGVAVDIWKIEGLSDPLEYQHVVSQARSNGRDGVGVIILGRGESREMVVEWIAAGRNTPGVIGFAVGRTIFWQPLMDLKDKKIDRETAIDRIAKNYIYFYQLFTGKIS